MLRKLLAIVGTAAVLLFATDFGETCLAFQWDGHQFVIFDRLKMPDARLEGSTALFNFDGHTGSFDGRCITVDGRSAEVPTDIRAVRVRSVDDALVVTITRPRVETTILPVPHTTK